MKRGGHLRVALAGVFALAALALSAATALALTDVKSTVVITAGGASRFEGRVSSPRNFCEPGRDVKLYREIEQGSFELVEEDATNGDGEWRIRGDFRAGNYRALVVEKKVTHDRQKYLCKIDRSPVFRG